MGSLFWKSGICLVWVGTFFPPAHQTSGESQNPCLKLFKLTWTQIWLERTKTGLRNAKTFDRAHEEGLELTLVAKSVQKLSSASEQWQRIAAWFRCSPASFLCPFCSWAAFTHVPSSLPVHKGWLFPKWIPWLLSARLDLKLWSPKFSESRNGAAGRSAEAGEPNNVGTQTRLQQLCSRPLLTNPATAPLLPSLLRSHSWWQGMYCRAGGDLCLSLATSSLEGCQPSKARTEHSIRSRNCTSLTSGENVHLWHVSYKSMESGRDWSEMGVSGVLLAIWVQEMEIVRWNKLKAKLMRPQDSER